MVTSKATTPSELFGEIINPEIVQGVTKKDRVEVEDESDENDRTGDETLTSRIINTRSRNKGSSSRRADIDRHHNVSVDRREDEHHGVDNTQDVSNLRGDSNSSILDTMNLQNDDDLRNIPEISIENNGLNCEDDDLEMTSVYDYFNAIDPVNESKGVGAINSGNSEDHSYLPIYEQIGCLRYLADRSRPDILYAVNYLSRYMVKPNEDVLIELHRLLRYINKTKAYELVVGGQGIELFAMVDASFVSTGESRSQMGHAIYLWEGSGSVCSYSKRSTTVALSTTHAETDALTECIKEVLWFQGFLRSVEISCNEPTIIWVDNNQTIINGNNSTTDTQKKSKYYLVKLNWIKEQVMFKLVNLTYIPSEQNHSDIFTKALTGKLLRRHTKGVLGTGSIPNDDDGIDD
jgi:hypothetical protein